MVSFSNSSNINYPAIPKLNFWYNGLFEDKINNKFWF